MTVEEKILQYVGDSAKPTVKRLLKEHTIQIAEKAVEEEIEKWRHSPNKQYVEYSLNRLLSQIKTLTENE